MRTNSCTFLERQPRSPQKMRSRVFAFAALATSRVRASGLGNKGCPGLAARYPWEQPHQGAGDGLVKMSRKGRMRPVALEDGGTPAAGGPPKTPASVGPMRPPMAATVK